MIVLDRFGGTSETRQMKKGQVRMNIRISLLLLTVLLVAVGCVQKGRARSWLTYSESAEALYEKGVVAFERRRWTDAAAIFTEVVREYPYSKFVAVSELRIADCRFFQGSHAEAAVTYDQFLKTYPTHAQAHYAAFMKCRSYYEQIPGHWFLTPPNHEKDLTATQDARIALSRFLQTWSDSEYLDEARELYAEVERLLVRHELYVAAFYLKKDQKKAAAIRLTSIEKQYPESPLVPDAMFQKAITLLQMGQQREAMETFRRIVRLYPEHYQALRAGQYLDSLQ
jgi:outer membrane protein assembly factor BamD